MTYTEDGRWLSYTELASERGISRASAIRMVRRHRWRRQTGNDGEARVFVPSRALPDDIPRVMPEGDGTGQTPDMPPGALSVLEEALAALRERAEVAEARAERAERAVANERERIDRLVHEFGEARREADAAGRAALDEARQRADTLHQGLAAAEGLATSLRAELDAARQEAQAAAEAAESARAEAEVDAAERQQAEAARKGRGRLARLRAAWRGE